MAIESRKPRTQKDYKRLIERHFLSTLEHKRLPDLTFEDIMACVKDVSPGEAFRPISDQQWSLIEGRVEKLFNHKI